MKTTTAFILTAAMALSFTGCDSSIIATKSCYTSTSDVTLEKLIENSSPEKMVEYKGGFKEVYDYSGSGVENMDDGEFYTCYKKTGDLLEFNYVASYPDEYSTVGYISSDKKDPYYYSQTPMGITKSELSEDEINKTFSNTVLGYIDFDAALEDVTEKDGNYIATVKISQEGAEVGTDTITIDPKSGMILKVKSTQQDGNQELEVITEFTYTKDIQIDTTPKTEYRDPVEAEEVTGTAGEASETAETTAN